jgi:hypothetical protein
MQLAIAASLIILPVFCIFLGLVLLHQFINKQLFNPLNLLILSLNLALIYYWVSFSSHLKSLDGLTHGAGDSYWLVTFETLIYMVTGSYSQWLQILLATSTILLIVFGFLLLMNQKEIIKTLLSKSVYFFLIAFLLELVGIYLMKKIMGINYPEDRTALFFYFTLVLFVVFLVDEFQFKMNTVLISVLALSIFIQFFFKLNFKKHELYIYDTFPDRFYHRLLKEQASFDKPITIGGHRCREFIYGFQNYRSGGSLNAMDAPELLHMNADYLVAKKGEKPFYDRYYTEIDSEPNWDFRLLKRRSPIVLNQVDEIRNRTINSSEAFTEFIHYNDKSKFNNSNPIRVDFTFKVSKNPIPFEAWLVVQIDSLNGNKYCFKRSALNWIKNNFESGKEYTFSVITPALPDEISAFKAFLWNIKQEEIDFTFTSVKVYQMEGNGINYVAPIYY